MLSLRAGILYTGEEVTRGLICTVCEPRPDKRIMTRGAAMNPELAKALGVLYGPDAASGVRMLGKALSG